MQLRAFPFVLDQLVARFKPERFCESERRHGQHNSSSVAGSLI